MAPQTGIPALDWFLVLLDSWGYLIVSGFTIVENLFIIGSPTPGDIVLMSASFVSLSGGLNPFLVGGCAVLGAVTGSTISYWFGRRGGRAAIIKWGGKLVDAERILAAEEYFERHGDKTVFLSRFAAGFKNFVPVIAGASQMRFWVFELYTVIGAILHAALMVTLGRLFAENFDTAITIAKNITWAGFAAMTAMLVLIFWGRSRLIAKRVEDLTEDAAEHGHTIEHLAEDEADA